jgi:hypothetical protein
MQDSFTGVESALFLALTLLGWEGLADRFRGILEAAAVQCRLDAAEAHGESREALEALAAVLERAARHRPFEVIDGGKAD